MGLVASGCALVRVGLALCILFARLPVCIGVVTSGRIPVRDGLCHGRLAGKSDYRLHMVSQSVHVSAVHWAWKPNGAQ